MEGVCPMPRFLLDPWENLKVEAPLSPGKMGAVCSGSWRPFVSVRRAVLSFRAFPGTLGISSSVQGTAAALLLHSCPFVQSSLLAMRHYGGVFAFVWFGLVFVGLFGLVCLSIVYSSAVSNLLISFLPPMLYFFPSSYLPWILGFPFMYFSQVCECGACNSLVCSPGTSTHTPSCQPLCHWMFLLSSLSLHLYTYKALFWDAIRHQENLFLCALLGRDEQLWVLTPHWGSVPRILKITCCVCWWCRVVCSLGCHKLVLLFAGFFSWL